MDWKIDWSGKLQALKRDYLLIRENFPVTWCRLIWKCRVCVRHPMFCVRSLGMAAFCFRRQPKWIRRPNVWTETNDLRWSHPQIQYQFEWHLSSATNVENQRHGPRCRSTSAAIETRIIFCFVFTLIRCKKSEFGCSTSSLTRIEILPSSNSVAFSPTINTSTSAALALNSSRVHVKFCVWNVVISLALYPVIEPVSFVSLNKKICGPNWNKMNKIALRLVASRYIFIYVGCSRYTRPINNKCVRCCCGVGRRRTVWHTF